MGRRNKKYVKDIININREIITNENLNKKICFDIIRIVDSNNQSTNILFNNISLKLVQSTQNIFLNKKYDIIHIHYLNEPAFILYNYIIDLISTNHAPKLFITLHDYHFIINDKINEYHLTTINANKHFLDELKEKQSNIMPYMLYKKLFLKSDLIITGGSTVRVIYNYVFGLKNNLIKVVPHPEKKYFDPIPKDKMSFNTLNICVIGALSISKGSHMIQEMSNFLQLQKKSWKIFHLGLGFTRNLKKQSNIISLGSYGSETHLRELLITNNINLIWFPAFRHESFCYTLTLAMQTELPIIAYDSGTFRERLSFYNSPYKIHECDYSCELLYKDIKDFYDLLSTNKYVKQLPSEFSYDNIKYDKLYIN